MKNDTGFGLYFLGLCLGIGLVFSSIILARAFLETRMQTISVKGVAEQTVTSDLGVWEPGVTVDAKTLPEAFAKLQADMDKLQAYLKANGVDEKSIQAQPVIKSNVMQMTASGMESGIIDSYRLSQNLLIQSGDVSMLDKLQRQVNSLYADGVNLNSYSPRYMYTQLENLKVGMLSEATQNAMQRAQEMASNTGNRIGSIRNARQGVFQITNPANSNDVSDYGYSDTSSIEKRVRAIVSIDFGIKN